MLEYADISKLELLGRRLEQTHDIKRYYLIIDSFQYHLFREECRIDDIFRKVDVRSTIFHKLTDDLVAWKIAMGACRTSYSPILDYPRPTFTLPDVITDVAASIYLQDSLKDICRVVTRVNDILCRSKVIPKEDDSVDTRISKQRLMNYVSAITKLAKYATKNTWK